MPDWQDDPGGLYVPPSLPDGAYLLHKAGVRFTEFLRLADGTNTTVTVDPITGHVTVDASYPTPTQLVPLTTAIGTSPDFVWDHNDELVMMEVPS